ncbi:MAG TPA: glycosyltransferase family 4 protein [Fibrobacteraceae bacterium]|jgi:glycosyltransferase involved in cell wall biosynthesis|nr:glycosyltransferase family 4 protein [Fibrobacter sp.]HPW94312.1 glycosyltransferase family 4 protein [Fibrobacteraceae bacterium]
MKILVVNYRDRKHPASGGAEKHLHCIFSRIVEKGHQVVLFSTSFPGAPSYEIVDGIEVIRSGSDLLFQLTYARAIKKLDRKYQFDVIYEDLNKLPLFTPQLSKKPHIIQIHHLWKRSIFSEAFFPVALGVWLFEKMIPLFYKKSHFIVVSPSTEKELEELGIASSQIQLVYNGADGLPPNVTLPLKKSDYFLWLSRLHRYKGIYTALEAFRIFSKKYPDVKLRIAGGGPLLKKMPKIIERYGLTGKVILEGYVSGEKKRTLLAEAIGLLQTSYKEGWGLTVIEAAECKTATIASAVPGLVDSVIDQKTGILFPMKDASSCAQAMELFYLNSERRELFELEAQMHAAEFTWDKAALETLKILEWRVAFSK